MTAQRGEPAQVTEADVRSAITEFMGTDSQTNAWMRGKFPAGPLKGERPVDLVAAGRGQDVLDLIAALQDGAYL